MKLPQEGTTMKYDELKNPDLQAKLRNAKTAKELVALAKESGLELSDDQLAAISGGQEWYECDRDECFEI